MTTSEGTGTELEERVRAVWAEILDLADPAALPLDRDFLDAGGSSLLLVMLWEDLRELTDRQLRVSDLFRHSTIRAQAAFLAGTEDRVAAPAGPAARGALLGRAGGRA
ncbi:acyl carrier protein [Amycolatopsis sp. NPDC003731]